MKYQDSTSNTPATCAIPKSIGLVNDLVDDLLQVSQRFFLVSQPGPKHPATVDSQYEQPYLSYPFSYQNTSMLIVVIRQWSDDKRLTAYPTMPIKKQDIEEDLIKHTPLRRSATLSGLRLSLEPSQSAQLFIIIQYFQLYIN